MKFTDMVYNRPDFMQISHDYSEHIEKFAEAETAELQWQEWQALNKIENKWNTAAVLGHIHASMDTTDDFFAGETAYYDEYRPKFDDLKTKFYRELLQSGFRAEHEKKVGKLIFIRAEQKLATFNADIIPLLIRENKLISAYNSLRSSATLPFADKICNLAELVPFTMDIDRKVRQEAVKVYTDFFAENSEKFNRIFADLVAIRTEIAHKLGYKNFIDLGYARMGRVDYTVDDVNNYRQSVVKYIVPLAGKLLERQRQRLGSDKLDYVDELIQFPGGNPLPKGDQAELVAKAETMYKQLSPETAEFFSFMTTNELMDLTIRKGKHGGGYCNYIFDYQAPFIFSNFNGTADDIDVLTHEAGHAFQLYCSREAILPEYIWATMDAAEIHSMSMEFLTSDYMHMFFGADELKYDYAHLASAILFIPYGVLVDHFQHEIYEHPEFTPAERMQKWRELEKIYLPHRDYRNYPFLQQGGYWLRQSHIFQMPFYYIDYTLAQNCALQFWYKSKEDFTGTWQNYLALCKLGGSQAFLSLVEAAELANPFKPATLELVAAKVENYLNKIEEVKLQ